MLLDEILQIGRQLRRVKRPQLACPDSLGSGTRMLLLTTSTSEGKIALCFYLMVSCKHLFAVANLGPHSTLFLLCISQDSQIWEPLQRVELVRDIILQLQATSDSREMRGSAENSCTSETRWHPHHPKLNQSLFHFDLAWLSI